MSNAIIRQFLDQNRELYERGDQLSSEERELLFALEESLVALRGRMQQQQLADLSVAALCEPKSESDLAEFADLLLAGRPLPRRPSLAELAALQQIVKAHVVMPRLPNRELPPVLAAIVERDREAVLRSKQADQLPAIVVRLGREAMRVVKSTLQGINLSEPELVATRSAHALLGDSPRLTLSQVVHGDHSDSLMEYQVVRESENEVMLAMQFEQRPGQYRVALRSNGRLVDSHTLPQGEHSVSFSRLPPGYYEVEVRGPVSNRFALVIES